jgi:8-oxo-dGTP diphosphatase
MRITNVVAAIIRQKNLYLIVKRNRNKHFGLKWEFPGGKVEIGENFHDALIREIKEELNISIKIQKKIAQKKYKDTKINIIIHYYLCSLDNGKIKLLEHEDLSWVEKKNFLQYDFVPGDKEILSFI